MKFLLKIYEWKFLIGVKVEGNKITRIAFTFEDDDKLLRLLNATKQSHVQYIKSDNLLKNIIDVYLYNKGLNNILKLLQLDYCYKKYWNFWLYLTQIKFGEVITYGFLSKKFNMNPRFVGKLLSRNKFELIFPCHRIISKSGIGGFRGKDCYDKLKILEFEQSYKTIR